MLLSQLAVGKLAGSKTYTRIKSILTDSPLAPLSPFGPWNWYVKGILVGKRLAVVYACETHGLIPANISTKGTQVKGVVCVCVTM